MRGSDPGHYEERYRLTGRAIAGLAVSVVVVGLGFLWQSPVIFLVIGIILAVFVAQGAGVFDLAWRTIAFRADHEGILLGAVPDKLSVRRGSALFIPWADVERIILYPAYPRGPARRSAVQCIGVQRRAAAAPLRWGNEQAPGCPVPGSRPGLPGRSPAGSWTAGALPPSSRRQRPAFPSWTPVPTPAGKDRAGGGQCPGSRTAGIDPVQVCRTARGTTGRKAPVTRSQQAPAGRQPRGAR